MANQTINIPAQILASGEDLNYGKLIIAYANQIGYKSKSENDSDQSVTVKEALDYCYEHAAAPHTISNNIPNGSALNGSAVKEELDNANYNYPAGTLMLVRSEDGEDCYFWVYCGAEEGWQPAFSPSQALAEGLSNTLTQYDNNSQVLDKSELNQTVYIPTGTKGTFIDLNDIKSDGNIPTLDLTQASPVLGQAAIHMGPATSQFTPGYVYYGASDDTGIVWKPTTNYVDTALLSIGVFPIYSDSPGVLSGNFRLVLPNVSVDLQGAKTVTYSYGVAGANQTGDSYITTRNYPKLATEAEGGPHPDLSILDNNLDNSNEGE